MATITLNSTISDEFANSYCDQDFADQYFENHVVSTKRDAWDALEDDQKANALIQACYIIEQLKFTVPTNLWDSRLQYDNLTHRYYYSYPADPSTAVKQTPLQALQFPRNVDTNFQGTFMPERVMMAQCEQALYMTTLDESTVGDSLQGVTSQVFQAGGVTISQRMNPGGLLLSPIAQNFLNPYIMQKTGIRLNRA
jgi:hypothetical protein